MTLRSSFFALAAVITASLSLPTCRTEEEGAEEGGPPKAYVALQPFGQVPAEVLEHLKRELPKRFFGLPVEVLKPLPLPKGAYDPERRQYRASHFILELRRPKGAVKVLGVVDKDLYTIGLNFVFGQAVLGGEGGVIALARLRPEFWGEKAEDPKGLFLERALKEAVHELGHAFGLDHCPNPKCAMRFSNTIWDTDRKGADFCSRCRRLLEKGFEGVKGG